MPCINFSIPGYGISQFFVGWPASFSGGNGFFSTGVPGYGSYMAAPALFSPMTPFSTGGQGLYNGSPYMSSSISYGSMFVGTGGFSPFTFQSNLGTNSSPFLNGGFGQATSSLAPSGWGFSLPANPFQPFTSFGSSSQYTGGIQSNNFYRGYSGSQGFATTSPSLFGGSNNRYSGVFQNPLTWAQSYSSSSPSSQSNGNDSQLVEMPPVSQGQGDKAEYVANQILVKFYSGVTREKQKTIHDKHGCNDRYFSYQWHHTMMKNTSAWDLGQGTGVTVALLDSA